jgi:urease accessory protein UreE
MTTTMTRMNETFGLRKDETLRLPHGVAVIVRVERGTVLVTQEGDHEDHVLEQGDDLVVPAGGVAVAWAFTEALVSVRAADRRRLAA